MRRGEQPALSPYRGEAGSCCPGPQTVFEAVARREHREYPVSTRECRTCRSEAVSKSSTASTVCTHATNYKTQPIIKSALSGDTL